METSGSQSANQNSAQNTSQASSSKNLKNWFDEFKARVSKKSQQVAAQNEANETSTNQVESEVQHALKESLGKTRPKSSSLRFRRTARIQVEGSRDFETASINTIFNRRDSRYETSPSKVRCRSVSSKILSSLRWIILYIIPFNYNLPWKLLCLINTSFVIVVIGLASGSTEASTVFSFSNGFICGLATGCISFVILSLSFFLHILPKSRNERENKQAPKPHDVESLRSPCSLVKDLEDERETRDIDDLKQEDFSLYEVLEENPDLSADDLDNNVTAGFIGKLDDEDYKGWMIEFVGDYELRNTSEIKLKSIYVKLEDHILYLCKTKNNYDADSAVPPVILSQRVYDLKLVKKLSANLLLPKNVRNKQKYVWSKKYPIRLDFHVEENGDADSSNELVKQIQITLFARSCREKEEWFRRFKRIVEVKRFGRRHSVLRSSMRSEESFAAEAVSESFLSSFKRFRCRSPSPKRDLSVQTSQSSHLLAESKKITDDETKVIDGGNLIQPSSGLVRTKSCELIQPSQKQKETTSEQDQIDDEDGIGTSPRLADDSTLTRETADLFSQAIDHSNFLNAQPSLDYEDYIQGIIRSGVGATTTSDWFNALISRIFFDVFSHDHWSIWFKRKIQRKLYRIRLPYFMETLTLTQIDLGTNAPQFLNVVSHEFNSSGLSIDFDMAYSGGLTMTFETKLNLLKIKSDNSTANTTGNNPGLSFPAGSPSSGQQYIEMNVIKDCSTNSESSIENLNIKENSKPSLSLSASTRTSCESTSDSEDSDSSSTSDSSFDEAELNEISDWEDYGAEKTRQNIVKFVDKIASSRYFQHATENRYIKKKLKDISNCPLVLVVQIQSLNGILTLNVPPPQTDRLWYGFKPTPELTLKAIPKMGDREVSLSHVTDWIERKLAEEFKKILVIPNMEDIVLPVLKSDHMQYIQATR